MYYEMTQNGSADYQKNHVMLARNNFYLRGEEEGRERHTRSVPLGQCTDLAYGKTSPTINRGEASGLFASLSSARGNYL